MKIALKVCLVWMCVEHGGVRVHSILFIAGGVVVVCCCSCGCCCEERNMKEKENSGQ